MVSKRLKTHIEELLFKEGFSNTPIQNITTVSGGSVNDTYGLFTKDENYFIKLNNRYRFPKMFELEYKSLLRLGESTSLHVPQALLVGEFEEMSFLIMEFVESTAPKKNFWEEFANGLAALHQNTSTAFGLEEDNYNGSLTQINSEKADWSRFFIENRLMVQEKMARENNLITKEVSDLLEKFYSKIETLFPKEAPALLHGDLWSGNFMVNHTGAATIMDPAIYYGNREMDLAMSLLFGGFHKRFYDAYHETFPLIEGWQERVDVCNLYPLLVHVNLFGSSYTHRVKNILKKKV